MEGDWELLDGEDLLEGVGDLVEGEGELLGHKEVDQLPEGKIRSHPPPIPPNFNINSDFVFYFRYQQDALDDNEEKKHIKILTHREEIQSQAPAGSRRKSWRRAMTCLMTWWRPRGRCWRAWVSWRRS